MQQNNYKILAIEDDLDILELLQHTLTKEGYLFHKCNDGQTGLLLAPQLKPDLIIVDWMLPGRSGIDIIRSLRQNADFSFTPIIMLTAKAEDQDLVLGLEAGADDYITKPFRTAILLARIKRALRQYQKDQEDPILSLHNLEIDPKRHEIRYEGETLDLTSSEFKALYHLARKPGWVFTRNQIMSAVHGDGYIVSERSIDVMMVSLRKKIGEAGKLIETVRGVGYRMVE
jgi:two-component system, OmpR family, alkaline phosphatase synthesis response regulator PhoP